MRNVSSFFALAVVAATAVVGVAFAQTPAAAPAASPGYPMLTAPTVAVVDFQRVLQDSAAGRSIMSQLDTERRKFRDEYTRMEEELKTGENELKRKLAVMAPDQANAERDGLQRKQAEYQRILQEKQESIQKAGNEAGLVVNDNITGIVEQYALERHIGLVVRKDAVISMIDKNMDITDDIIQRLNAKLPSVTVNVAAPGATQTAGPAEAAPAPKSKK